MEEIWKDIDGYKDIYQISNFGNVKSLKRKGVGTEKILTPQMFPCRCPYIRLYIKRKARLFCVFKMVDVFFAKSTQPDTLQRKIQSICGEESRTNEISCVHAVFYLRCFFKRY
jgi:hypothetical protein